MIISSGSVMRLILIILVHGPKYCLYQETKHFVANVLSRLGIGDVNTDDNQNHTRHVAHTIYIYISDIDTYIIWLWL